jgi:hypothetical protein
MYRGEIMLGYTAEDLDNMIAACADGAFYLPPSKQMIARDLLKTVDLLQGLIAEGHVQ